MSEPDDTIKDLEQGDGSFAELLAESYREPSRLEPGERVSARVMAVSGDWVFLDIGRKGEGVVDRKELLDAEGNMTVKTGDPIDVYFISSTRGEFRFTTKIAGGQAGQAMLEDAWRHGIPVEGFVEKEVKGGYELKVAGSARAFCPHSQSGLRRGEGPEGFVGQHLSFRIIEYGERGRKIIASRRAILEEEQRQQQEKLREAITEGMTVTGRVSSLQKFGAFVDLGGIEGLIPMAELGWGRVADVSERLAVGQEVTVVVKKLDWAADRITLSLRDTLADPWQQVADRYPEGTFHTGRVSRLAPFGAFVTLEEGVDGLIHISRLGGGKRLNHPREVLQEGEPVEVKVEGVDREARRLSLALAGAARAADEEAADLERFRTDAASEASRTLGSLGDLLKAKLQK